MFAAVIPPGLGRGGGSGDQIGGDQDTVGTLQQMCQLGQRVDEVFHGFEGRDQVGALARAGLEAARQQVLAVGVVPQCVDAAVAQQAHQDAVAAGAVDDAPVQAAEQHQHADHHRGIARIAPHQTSVGAVDGLGVGLFQPVRHFGLHVGAVIAFEVGHLMVQQRAVEQRHCRLAANPAALRSVLGVAIRAGHGAAFRRSTAYRLSLSGKRSRHDSRSTSSPALVAIARKVSGVK